MSEQPKLVSVNETEQKQVLVQVLLLNLGLAAALLAGGLLADSSGLLANALDNGSDALTYAISWAAVTRSMLWKVRTARITAFMLLILALGVTLDAFRRYTNGSDPIGISMVVLALVATAINAMSLKLLQAFSKQDVNLRAAWTMSINDFASNIGILVAGGLVVLTKSNVPDLAVGLLIAAIAVYGSIKTFRDSNT